MIRLSVAISFFLVASMSCTPALAGQFWIAIDTTVTGPYTVDVSVETNIPAPAVLAVDLTIKGQKDEEVCICTDFIRVPIKDGKGRGTIDGSTNAVPAGTKLPAGEYVVEAKFYPMWPENRSIAQQAGISAPVRTTGLVRLTASGQASADARKSAEGRSWVMENFYMGYPWSPSFWANRFGTLQSIEYRGRGNPTILKLYYLASIDMTLLVNELKGEIVTYRLGKAYE